MQVVLLDLDGVLAMSEHLVLQASCPLINETIKQKGVTVQYTASELKDAYVGLGFTSIIRAIGTQHGFTVTPNQLQQLSTQELALVVEILESQVESSPGAAEMLSQMRNWGVTCAVVSSSELVRIRACLRRTGLEQYIPPNNIFSATDSLPKPEGKPSPAIYQFAMEMLGTTPDKCLAVEDSPSGVRAAVRAGIEVVGYLGAEESPSKRDTLSRKLLEAGASATFHDWSAFLTWLRPRLSTAS